MSYDFRRGTLPSGAFAEDYPQIAALPFAVTVDYTSATVDSGSSGYFQVPGTGDPRQVPQAIISLALAREWDMQVSLSGPGGLSHSWGGTITRGIERATDPDGTVDTGAALTTIHDAWSLRIVPPETEEGEYLRPVTELTISGESGGTNFYSQFVLNLAADLFYYAIPDTWVVAAGFTAIINDGVFGGDAASVTTSPFDPTTAGLTVCGAPWLLTGSGVTDFTASIKPTNWLS